MTPHERSRQLTRVLAALVAQIRDRVGAEQAQQMFDAAIKAGSPKAK